MIAEARATLLQGLIMIVSQYVYSTDEGGLAAMRLLRTAGVSWADLLGPPLDREALKGHSYAMQLATYGHRPMPSFRDCGRAILTIAHVATAYELTRTVAFVHTAPPASPATSIFAKTVSDLLARDQLETAEVP